MDYIPPKYNSAFFKFTKVGYVKPDFNKTNFSFDPMFRDLKSTITGTVFQTDYLKSCNTKVVGFSSGNIQVLRDNCIYGGIRDLQVFLFTSNYVDFGGYIKSTLSTQDNLGVVLRPWYKELSYDLRSAIKGWNRDNYTNLPVYLKQTFIDNIDLNFHLKTFLISQVEIASTIRGWSVGNIQDLLSAIQASTPGASDIYSYIKPTIQDAFDLEVNIFKIWQHNNSNIPVNLHGWQTLDLQKIIQALHIKDLLSTIRATYIRNISAFLYAIQPVNLGFSLMGWAEQNLNALVLATKYGGDLLATITAIPPADLGVTLFAKKGIGVAKDLNFRMTNFYENDLNIYLNVFWYKDLGIFLNSSKQTFDLQVKIYPKIVFVRQNINLSFLENRDLACIVNFPCFNSGFRDLLISLYSQYKKDLPISIWGFDSANIVDLGCSINAYDYVACNMLPIHYVNLYRDTSSLILEYKKSAIFSINTLHVMGANITKGYVDIKNYIYGEYLQKDLNIFIRAYSNKHYTQSNIIDNFITLQLKDNEEEFRKHITLEFNSYANNYYYFSGNQRAYRTFQEDHWVVFVEGFKFNSNKTGEEKAKVMRKYIFSLRNYNSIDEAIRDMIDRVTIMKHQDLNTFIFADNNNIKDLGISIKANKVFKTTRSLPVRIKVGSVAVVKELYASIFPQAYESTTNLECTIIGTNYESSIPTDPMVFNFEGAGGILPDPENINFEFLIEE